MYHRALFLALFFVLFINDLPDVVCSASTIYIALYADDSKMFRVINCDDIRVD